jgi:hypothetical protein
MNLSGITFAGGEDMQRLRQRLQMMTDQQLRKFGREARAREHSDNPAFKIQVDEARLEWRRRHPVMKGLCSSCGHSQYSHAWRRGPILKLYPCARLNCNCRNYIPTTGAKARSAN